MFVKEVRMPAAIALDGMTSIHEMVHLARRADALGLPSVWVAEHVGYREGFASSMAVLAATERITVVPAATSVYSRHPMVAAMAAATLEEHSPGRTMLTLATGNPRAHGREMGLPMRDPVATTREYAAVLRGLWSGKPFDFPGKIFRLERATFYVMPARTIPLFVAAMGPRMLELAGQIGDGVVFSAGLSAASLTRCVARVKAGASQIGRDPKTLNIVAILIVAVSSHRDVARRQARGFLAYALRNRFIAENVEATGTPFDIAAAADAAAAGDWETAWQSVPDDVLDHYAIAGTRAECEHRLREFLVEGIGLPVLLPLGDVRARREVIELALMI